MKHLDKNFVNWFKDISKRRELEKYSVEVDYGMDSSLIRREKTSQLDKSNKYTDWKIPEGGQIRLLGKPMEYAHYRVNSEAKFSPEDVEKIKESWKRAKSVDVCHKIEISDEPVEEMFVKKNVIGVDWGQGVEERYAKKDYVGASPLPKVDLEEARRKYWDRKNSSELIKIETTDLEKLDKITENVTEEESSKCPNCVGTYVCWDCRL